MAWQLSFPVDEPVDVVVTHVEKETGNFFVQINDPDSKLDDLMEKIANYVAANSGDSKTKTLKVGDACLAKYVDEVWYRGKILGSDRNGYKVFFVDYGNSDFVVRNNVLSVLDKFLTLPPQAYECELANVRAVGGGQWGTELLVKFEELVLEQAFIAQAISLKTNNVLVLSLFKDATMTTLAVERLISDGYLQRLDAVLPYVHSGPSRSYEFLKLDNFTFEDVHISYCENPNKFCCILLKNSTALRKLMEELEITYRDAADDDYPLTSCCQDNPCCAKYSEDDMWYRAIITSESPSPSGEITVRFVDYGNSESVLISSLMELNDRFLELPMQALECSLYGIKPSNEDEEWPQDAIELFETMTNEKQLVSYLYKVTNNMAEVFLFDTSEETKDINFGEVMVESGKAIAVKSLKDYKKVNHSPRRKSSFGIIDLVPNTSKAVIVTNIESPSDFYCQLLTHSSDLDKLMNDISQYYEALSDVDDTITLPQTGMMCCGRYTEDDGWYRALILASDIANRQVEVLYVDYGNTEILPITRIKELKPQFETLPQQAVSCCLYGINPTGPSWTEQAIEEFQNAVVDKELVITVVSHMESQRYGVSLVETVGKEEYSINKQLVQKGLALSEETHPGVSVEANISDFQPPAVEVESYIDIEVTHVENLDQFWCHLMTSTEEMECLMSNLQEYYDGHLPRGADLNLFSQGSPCCARFSDDKLWYRAKILEKMRNNLFKVRFVDYGNCELVASKSVAVLNPEFLQLPVQAVECSLANLPDSDKKKNKFVHKFLEMVNGKELVCRMDERDERGKYLVLIIDSGDGETVNINEEMAEFIACSGKQGARKEPVAKLVPKLAELNLEIGKEESVFVTCVNSSENFYCQLARTSTQLDKLMNDMESFYRPLPADEETLTSPAVGEVCCAMFTEDDGFYRAVVTKVSSTTIGVHYVDYGNSEELPPSRVKSLNASFTELPAQSFNAKTLSSRCGTAEEFETKVIDQELIGKIVRKDENGLYVVQLSDSTGTPLFSDGAGRPQGTSNRTPRKVKDARVPVGQKTHVYITSVTSPNDLFCQLTETSAELDDLMNEIEEHYRPLGEEEQAYTDPQIGEACCAMFTEDDGWYRATIEKRSGANVDVYYIDYGNSETLPLSRTKVLHEKFTTLTSQGFHACVKIPTGVDASSFKNAVLEKEFDAKIIKKNGNNVHEIELFGADGVKMFGSTADKKEPAVCQVKEADIRKGSKEHVYVTCYTSSQNFFCQLVKSSTQLDDLMDKLEEFYRPLGGEEECLNNPHVGDSCCAMFTEDDGWYRAVITKVSGNTVQVKYLDYGNIEELPVSRIKRLPPCFAEMNVQGFQASLVGAVSVSDDEVRAAIDAKELMVRVIDKKTSGVYDVEVYEMNGNRLFDSTPAKSQTSQVIKDFLDAYNMTAGAQLDVCGSHCDSPKQFYLHILKNKETLERIMTELDEVYSDLRPNDNAIANPVVGMFCAAKYPADDGWYRAKIINIPSPNEVEVCYIDFGNCERAGLHDIKSLAPAFYQPPVQAVKCCLNGAKEKSNANECETFEILVLEQHLIVDVKSVDLNTGTLTVDLFDTRGSDNLNILNVLNDKTSGKSSKSQGKPPKLASLPKLQLKDVENVLVESAESLDNFVCQFCRFNNDLDTVADMMYEMYHQGTPPGFVTTPLQVGDVIAALFSEDETWYRASVSGVNPDGSVNVMFIDYGNSETISKTDIGQRVRYLGKELLRYPVMRGVVCSLSRVSTDGKRYSWTPRAHAAFVRYVVEKEFRARLSSDSEPYKTILEEKSGSIHTWLAREKLVKTSETEPEVVQDDFYELEVEAGTSCDVYVTAVVNPEQFFVQQAANADAIDNVMNDLYASCTDGSRGPILNIHEGTLCAAQYTADDAWYRAKVTRKTGPDLFEVVFVDYGNSEVLSEQRIKELDPSLLELPAQALQCTLQFKQPKSWSPEIIEEFENITADKCLKMTVVKSLDGKLLVNMAGEDGVLLNDMFEKKSDDSGEQDSSKGVEVHLLPYPVTENHAAEVYISHLNGPGDFYLQFSVAEEELSRLTEQCEIYDGAESEKYKINNPQKGMYCCARYSEDNAWYRAQVMDIDLTQQTVTVCFVDHGNTDVVNIASDLRQLSADLLASPCQAVPCSLARGPWSSEQCSSFETATMDKPLQATFNEFLDNTWLVTLQDGDVSLNDLLIRGQEKPCVGKPSISIGDEPAVYIISVNSADDVVLQLSSYVEDLDALMADIASSSLEGSLPITDQDLGSYCLAKFTEDEAWYRAKVLELDGDKTKVFYVDYGNEEWVPGDRLAPIPERFSILPQVCFRCSLDLSSLRDHWNENFGEKLVEMYGERELRCEIISETNGCFSVKLFCDDEDVLTKLATSAEPQPTLTADDAVPSAEPLTTLSVEDDLTSRSYRMKQLNKGDRKDVLCSHIETPQKLWFRFVEDGETLDNLMNRLHEVYSVLGADELLLKTRDIGSPCCGQFLEDDGWYRAEILAVQDQGVLVRYVDYGNEEVLPTSRLRCLNDEFFETPCQAVVCLLKAIQAGGDEWSPDAVALVENFTSERSLSAEILSVDELTITGFVYGSLEDEEISLNDLLVEKSFAVNISQEYKEGQAELSDTVLSYTNIPVKVGDKINLFYVTADSPASIWCQLSDSEADLLDLMEQLGAFYGSLGADDLMVEDPVTGMAVCAQFTEDDSWYRAEILQTGTDILVHFVDYGNNEELPHSRIKRFKQDFVALPKQAVSLSLSGVSPQSLQEWSEGKQVAMEELCSEKCFVGEIREITDTTLVVSLKHQDSDVMLLDELCKANLISKLADIPAETTLETEEQPVDKHTENTLPLEEQSSEDTAALEKQTSGDTAALEEQTSKDTAALEEQTSKDTVALEEQTSEDAAALEKQRLEDNTTLEELPSDEIAALEKQMSEKMEDSEEQTSEDNTGLQEQTEQDIVTLNDSASDEQSVDNTATLEGKLRDEVGVLKENQVDGPPNLEEPIQDKRPFIRTQDNVVLPETIVNKNEDDNHKRETSGDNEEDLDDAEAVCHAIDCLLTEIDSRNSEENHITKVETSSVIGAEHEEAIAIITNEEASDDKTIVESTSSTVTGVFDNGANTNVKFEPPGIGKSEESGIDSEETISVLKEGSQKLSNESSEISALVSDLHEDAPESNSTISSSNPTPCLSPEAQLTDESPSDGTSTYFTPPEELIQETVNEEKGAMSSPESDRDDNRRRYAHPEITRGDIYKVKICHIQTPSSFFCQLLRTEVEFCHLMETIQTQYNEGIDEIHDLDVPSAGVPCCVQSPEDEKWYRAIIKNIEGDDDVTVMLVDVGKRLLTPVRRLKAISDVLVTSLPRHAVHCSLVDLEPAETEWSADAVTKMSEVCSGKSLEGEFISRRNKIYNIFLRDPENDASDFINRLLVDLKLATVTGRYSPDSGEGADSTENSVLNQEIKPDETADDEKLPSGSNTDSQQSESSRMDSTKCAEEILDNILEQVENERRDEVEMLDEVPFGDSEQNNIIIVDSSEEDGKKTEKAVYEDNGKLDKELFVDEQSEKVGESEEKCDPCNVVQNLVFQKKDAENAEGEADEQNLPNEVLEFSSSREQANVNGGEIEVAPDEMLSEKSPDQNDDDDDDSNVNISSALEGQVFEKDAELPEDEADEQIANMHYNSQNEDLIEQKDVIDGEIKGEDATEYITPDEMLPEQSPDQNDDDTHVDSFNAVEDLVNEKKDAKLPEDEADEQITNIHCNFQDEDLKFSPDEQKDVFDGEIKEEDATEYVTPDEMLPEQSPDQNDDDGRNVDTCNAVEDLVNEKKEAKVPECEADEQIADIHWNLQNKDQECSSEEQANVNEDKFEDDVKEYIAPDEMLPEQSPDQNDDDDINVDTCNTAEDQVYEKKDAKLSEDEASEQIANIHCGLPNENLECASEKQTDVIRGEIEEDDVKESITPDKMLPEQSPDQNDDDDINVDTCNTAEDQVYEKKDAKLSEDEASVQIANIHCGLQNENLECSSEKQADVIGGEIEEDDVKESITPDKMLPEQSPDENDGDDANVETFSEEVPLIMDDDNACETEEESLHTEKSKGKDLENVVKMLEPEKNDCIIDEENPPVDEESKQVSNETSDVYSSELSKLEAQIDCEDGQFSETIEHEATITRNCEEETRDNVEVSVDAKEVQSGEIGDYCDKRSNGFLGETKENDGDIICCVEIDNDIDVTEETRSHADENLPSCEENEIKSALERDTFGDSPEQAILDALVGEVVSHEEILRDENVGDLDID